MGAISYIPGADPAVIAAIVQAELAMNPPGSQLPVYAGFPSGYSDGMAFRNSLDGKMYLMVAGSFKEMDVKDNEVQDIFGTVLMNE